MVALWRPRWEEGRWWGSAIVMELMGMVVDGAELSEMGFHRRKRNVIYVSANVPSHAEVPAHEVWIGVEGALQLL